MTNDLDVMRDLLEKAYELDVFKEHGTVGIERLRDVLRTVREVYRHRPAETFPELVVLAPLDAGARPYEPVPGTPTPPHAIAATHGSATVHVMPNRTQLWWCSVPDDLQALAASAVIYVKRPEGEAFALPSGLKTLLNPSGLPSALAPPSFFVLEEALGYYGSQMARRSTCKILKTVWHDDRRLLLINKPEATMRHSLAQYLRVALREHAEIFEEQNVSETEPVDIKITYASAHRALIEIKWVGRSAHESGDKLGQRYSVRSRTDEGAEQLADYLDDHEDRSASTRTVGHLVVYDARRGALTTYPPNPSATQAWSYQHNNVPAPDRCQARDDFAEPTRFYLEPRR